MRIEDILDCDASTLEAMTDEQLLEHFKDVLVVTRPEQAPKRIAAVKNQVFAANPKLAQASAVLKNLGVSINLDLLKPLKRK